MSGWAAAASAGADLIGAGLGFAGQMISTKKQMKFAKEMYQNRYQWQMDDMQKAGLNPMLAYQQTAGSPAVPTVPNMLEAFSESARGLVGRASEAMTDVEKRIKIGEEQKSERLGQDLIKENVNKARAETHAASSGAVLANERAMSERATRESLLPAHTAKMLQEIEQSKSLVQSQGLMRELDATRLPRSRALGEAWDTGRRGAEGIIDLGRRTRAIVDEIPSVIQRWMSGSGQAGRGASGSWK